jgi:hypothetical protein
MSIFLHVLLLHVIIQEYTPALHSRHFLVLDQYKGHTPDKVNYAQWNTAWTLQQENSVSEVWAYILE